jgi:hypothetical protein
MGEISVFFVNYRKNLGYVALNQRPSFLHQFRDYVCVPFPLLLCTKL